MEGLQWRGEEQFCAQHNHVYVLGSLGLGRNKPPLNGGTRDDPTIRDLQPPEHKLCGQAIGVTTRTQRSQAMDPWHTSQRWRSQWWWQWQWRQWWWCHGRIKEKKSWQLRSTMSTRIQLWQNEMMQQQSAKWDTRHPQYRTTSRTVKIFCNNEWKLDNAWTFLYRRQLRLQQALEQNNAFRVILLDNVNWQFISTITSFGISRVFENNAVLQQSEGRC